MHWGLELLGFSNFKVYQLWSILPDITVWPLECVRQNVLLGSWLCLLIAQVKDDVVFFFGLFPDIDVRTTLMEVMRKAEDWTQVLFPVLKEQHHLLDGTFGYKDVRPSTSAFIKELLIHRPIEYIILRQVHTHALLVVIELDYMSATVKSNLSRDFIQANRFTKVSQFKPGVERRLVTSDGNVLQSLITLLVHDLLNDILISRIFWAKRMSNPDDSDCLVLIFGSTV